MKLYELSNEYLEVLDLLSEEENVELNDLLLKIDEEIELKAENIGKVLKSLEGNVAALKDEEKRLSNRRRGIENNIKNLKSYLENEMIAVGKKKFKTDLFSFGIQKNPPSLDISSEDNIPEEYYELTRSLIRRDLLKDMKEGLVVDGVSLKQSESLRIR